MSKRYQVQANRKDNGVLVKGYVVFYNDGNVVVKQPPEDAPLGAESVFRVDPSTIEPLAVPVIKEPQHDCETSDPYGYGWICPECDEILENTLGDFCILCGQRLLWPMEEE